MPIPTSIGDLSTTASLNSPAGSDNLSTTDDYLRAIQGIVKTVYDAQGVINSAQTTTNTGKANLSGATFTGDISVPDEAYGVGWNGSLEVPTKNAVYDKIQSIPSYKTSSSIGTGTLDQSAHNKNLFFSSACTITLPLISTLIDGTTFTITSNAANGTIATINTTSSQEITYSNTITTSLTLAQFGDSVTLVADGSSNRWRVIADSMGCWFSATMTGTQSAPTVGVATKVAMNSEQTDYWGCYDPTTNYRFTPKIAGIYEVSAGIYMASGANQKTCVGIYKNGAINVWGGRIYSTTDVIVSVSTIVLMNGTTDYIESYVLSATASGAIDNTTISGSTYFKASRIR
jgi:hypothetical protein